jgi:hypothetical protein
MTTAISRSYARVVMDYLYRYEARRRSQNGEDGIIAEILRRIGAPGRYFVEFGAADGAEGTCAALAEDGWAGLFMEADPRSFERLRARWRHRPDVLTREAFVTPATVEGLFADARAPGELDVLSIDVDSTDWHIWKALSAYSPRLVVIEYNAGLPLDRQLIQPLELTTPWDGTDWYGASLGAMELLAAKKRYALVHTETHGVNAFFVRDDLLPGTGLPIGPSAARHTANHFGTGAGHPRDPQNRPWVDLETGGRLVRLGSDERDSG